LSDHERRDGLGHTAGSVTYIGTVSMRPSPGADMSAYWCTRAVSNDMSDAIVPAAADASRSRKSTLLSNWDATSPYWCRLDARTVVSDNDVTGAMHEMKWG
jgi:hypothetical protein